MVRQRGDDCVCVWGGVNYFRRWDAIVGEVVTVCDHFDPRGGKSRPHADATGLLGLHACSLVSGRRLSSAIGTEGNPDARVIFGGEPKVCHCNRP